MFSHTSKIPKYPNNREQFLEREKKKAKSTTNGQQHNTTQGSWVQRDNVKARGGRSEMVLLFNNLQFSRWTFFKHLTPRKYTTLCQHNSTSNLSHFVTLTSRQKDQIHLYVDTLLQWNKVFYLFTFLFSHTTTTITLNLL